MSSDNISDNESDYDNSSEERNEEADIQRILSAVFRNFGMEKSKEGYLKMLALFFNPSGEDGDDNSDIGREDNNGDDNDRNENENGNENGTGDNNNNNVDDEEQQLQRQQLQLQINLSEISQKFEIVWELKHLEQLQIYRYPHPIFPSGIGNLKNTLKILILMNSNPLRVLPPEIGRLENLTRILIEGCNNLEFLPDELGELKNLEDLKLRCNPVLQYIPASIGNLHKLKGLFIESCHALQTIPVEIGNLISLEDFKVGSNRNLQTIPHSIGRLHEKLKILGIIDCPSIRVLPEEIGQLAGLEQLYLSRLDGIQTLPNGFGSNLQSLKYFSIYECQQLTSLGGLQHNWRGMCNLDGISVAGCHSLDVIPQELKRMRRLRSLNFSGISRGVILDFFAPPWVGNDTVQTIYLVGESAESGGRPEAELQLGEDYSKILLGLPPSLTRLDIEHHNIDDLSGFVSIGLPSGIRSLVLEENPILLLTDDRSRMHLQHLLEAYPQLGCITFRYDMNLYTPHLVHLMLLNRCGRILLVDSQRPVPLSVWPTILTDVKSAIWDSVGVEGSANDILANMEESVIFSLLQGPALLGRLAEGHDMGENHRKRQGGPNESSNNPSSSKRSNIQTD